MNEGAAVTDLLERVSLADPEVQENPDAYHHALHAKPLFFDDRLGFWICSKYQLMREILRNTEVFSSVDSQRMDAIKPAPAAVAALRRELYPMVDTMVTADPPQHTRVRTVMDPPFRPRSIAARSEQIRTIVDACIDEFANDGQCEFVRQFAIPIPVRVIAEMLGLPAELGAKIKIWSDAAVEPLGMMISDERHLECVRLTHEFQQFFAAELEARRRNPRDDLLTLIATARLADGQHFDMAQMLSITSQLLVAGNETTTNALAAGMQRLTAAPALAERLRAEPRLIRNFANEVLRLESPVQGLFRVVKRDFELAGQRLAAGDRVLCRFAAANRDPDQYPDPDTLDLARRNTGTNLAFGAGIHHCLGANLAREEMVQAFSRLLDRLEGFAFDPSNDFHHHPSMILRGLKALRITFRQRAVPGDA